MGTVRKLGIAWQVGVPSGWGTYGVNLALELSARGIEPALFFKAPDLANTPLEMGPLGKAIAQQPVNMAAFKSQSGQFDYPMLHALGDRLVLPPFIQSLRGVPDIGVVFFETAVIPAENIVAAKRFGVIIAGSSWNADVLRAHGLPAVRNCPQGVDLNLFSPAPKSDRFGDRFVVFSGGKLEYRKGQDLVIAAFQRFQTKYPDALLVTAWHSPWPQAARNMSMSMHLKSQPVVGADNRLDIKGWAVGNGIPEDAIVDIGPLQNTDTPNVLRGVDVALFPNRCEGGTNLVAMECMAAGIPAILSRNTGHLDLIQSDNCYSLDLQIPIGAVTGRKELDGWGESSIDEIVMRLEQAYADREDRLCRGVAAAAFMKQWNWAAQTTRFLQAIEEFTP